MAKLVPPRSGMKYIITLLLIGAVFLIALILLTLTGTPSKLLSASTYLDYQQQGDTGVGKYYLFFRRPTPPPQTNVIQDVSNTGTGTLPTDPKDLEQFFLDHPEELAKYRSEAFPALKPAALEEAALASGQQALEQCEIFPKGPIVEPWWRTTE